MSLSEMERAFATKLRNRGSSWKQVAKILCRDASTVRRELDPDWADGRREQINQARRSKHWTPVQRESGRNYVHSAFRPTEEEFRRLRKAIPADTRDLTGQLLGDPLPSRSALDKRSQRA